MECVNIRKTSEWIFSVKHKFFHESIVKRKYVELIKQITFLGRKKNSKLKMLQKHPHLTFYRKKSAKWHLVSLTFCGICYFLPKHWDIIDCIHRTIEVCVTFCIFFVPQMELLYRLCRLLSCCRIFSRGSKIYKVNDGNYLVSCWILICGWKCNHYL